FSAPNGALTITGSNLNASAVGSGNFDGGSIKLTGQSITASSAGGLSLLANATNSGNGGAVDLNANGSSSDINIGTGTGKFLISAIGGSASSSAGDGGTVSASAGRNLTVDMSSLSFGTKGANADGGILSLLAGTAGSGNLQVTGDIDARGVGT